MGKAASRVNRLERTLRVAGRSGCRCPTVLGVSGLRIVDAREGRRLPSDDVTHCQVCGEEMPVVRIVEVENWRGDCAGGAGS